MYGDWYARWMYIEGSPQYLYHLRHYGHPSKFGYKDLVKLWKAEKFDPDALMDRYIKAGARYFVAQAMHHDHFFNYPSKLNRFNSVEVGPMKDICGLWKRTADNFHLPFGLSEHLGLSFVWWGCNKGTDTYGPYAGIPYDGSDPAYRDFYLDNYEHYDKENKRPTQWYTSNTSFRDYWLSVMKEIIDLYTPELLYTDGVLPFGPWNGDPKASRGLVTDPTYHYGLETASYLYNKSIEKYGENRAVYTQKDQRPEIYRVGTLDVERKQLSGIQEDPWQTCTCIGHWFYDVRAELKRPGHIIEMLIDIVSKNGNMLLNIVQLPDGSIDEESGYILDEMASWNSVCAEGIYGTRPWRINGEGCSGVDAEGQRKEEVVKWKETDFRFTVKGNTVYAFMMKAPESRRAVIRSFSVNEKVLSVRLLGFGLVEFSQDFGILVVKLPQELPTAYTNCLAVELVV
jgi:alpha-L-fucosidase